MPAAAVEQPSRSRAARYPTPDPPLERLQSLEPQFEQLGARLLVLDAGRPHYVV